MPATADRTDEDALFARYRDTGDRDALAAVYDRTAARLLQLAVRLVGDREAAEDVLQTTFVAAMQNARRYDERRPLLSWLYAILRNEARRRNRTERRRPDCSRLNGGSYEAVSDPRATAIQRELIADVERVIAQMPELYRPVMRLRVVHGLSHDEIARTVRRPVATVRSQVMRGLRLLRGLLPAGLAGALAVGSLPAGTPPAAALPPVMSPGTLARVRAAVLVHAGVSRPVGSLSQALPLRRTLLVAGAVALLLGSVVLLTAWLPEAGVPALQAHHGAAGSSGMPLESARVDVRSEMPAAQRTPAAAPEQQTDGLLRLHVCHEGGRPATGAWVCVRPLGTANAYLREQWVQVDAVGDATLTRASSSATGIEVHRGDGQELQVAPACREATVTVPAGRTIEGVVVDEREQPIPGARIWLSALATERAGREVTRADGHGRFRLDGVFGDRYVGARAADHAASALVRTGAGRTGRVEVKLVMTAACGRVRGVVRDSLGSPVPFAEVWVGNAVHTRPNFDEAGRQQLPWPSICAAADAVGRFEVAGVPVGRTAVVARAPGRVGAASRVQVAAGRAAQVELSLGRNAVSGTVRDAAGAPVAGARVGCWHTAESWRGVGAVTDERGAYRLEDFDASNVWLWVDGGRRGVVSKRLRLDGAGGEVIWDPVLREARSPIRGVLHDPAGLPLAGWTIDVRAHTLQPGIWQPRTVTDAEGRFSYPFAADMEHSLTVVPPGEVCPCGPPVRVRPREEDHVVRLRSAWMPTAVVRVRVADATGSVPAECAVSLSRKCWVARRYLVHDHIWLDRDAEGAFHRGGVPPGEYDLTVYAPGFAPRAVPDLVLKAHRTHDAGVVRIIRRAPGAAAATARSGG